MTTTPVETVPTIWNDARDVPFFRITAGLFTFEFRLGASLLLARYDGTADTADTVQDAPTQLGCGSPTAPAGVGNSTRAERDLVPVGVRRTR